MTNNLVVRFSLKIFHQMSRRTLVGGGRTPMTNDRKIDKRTDNRDDRFGGEFSLKLYPVDQVGKVIPVRPMDVSKRGLGFLCRESLRIGSLHTLVIGEHRFRVELAYCSSHLGIDGLYRCGLFLRDADGSLHVACEKQGLLMPENETTHGLPIKRHA
jgi:hypothetical protein